MEEGEEQKQKQKLEVELGRRGRKLQKPKNVLASELQKPRNDFVFEFYVEFAVEIPGRHPKFEDEIWSAYQTQTCRFYVERLWLAASVLRRRNEKNA